MAGVHEDLRRRVVELVGLHRADDRDVVGDRREVRQQLGDLGARLPVPLELERRAEQLRRALDEREPLALDQLLGDVLAVVLRQLRLGIEQIELRRRAGHEQVDDALRLRREVERVGRRRATACASSGVVDQSEASARPPMPNDGLFEEVAASDGAER